MIPLIFLRFRNQNSEKKYRQHQFDSIRPTLIGEWGTFSVTTLASSIGLFVAYLEVFTTISRDVAPGIIEWAVSAIPFTVFNLYYLAVFQNFSNISKLQRKDCHFFGASWVGLLILTEVLPGIVFDSCPQSHGCSVKRFRCPNSFSSSKFTSKAIIITAIATFSMTPRMSLIRVISLVISGYIFSWSVELLTSSQNALTSVWSISCALTQIILFLTCRYLREMKERKRFLLQDHIHHLQTKLQGISDQMIPRPLLKRLLPGKLLIDYNSNAIVLLCSFPTSAPYSKDAWTSFSILDHVHGIFDQIMMNSNVCDSMFKVPFVGNDYMLISSECFMDVSNGQKVCDNLELATALQQLATQMSSQARAELENTGIALRFGIATGSVFAAVIGEKKKRFRIFGAAAAEAARLCQLAEPWQVLASNQPFIQPATDISGLSPRTALSPRNAPCGGALTHPESRQQGVESCSISCFDKQPIPTNPQAGRGRAARGGRVVPTMLPSDSSSKLLDDSAPSPISQVSAGEDAGAAHKDEKHADRRYSEVLLAFQTVCIGTSQTLFLSGIPGPEFADKTVFEITESPMSRSCPKAHGILSGEGMVKAAAILLLALAAAASVDGRWGPWGWKVARRRWTQMHAIFFGTLLVLAWMRAEEFLFLGFTMGSGLFFVAPPALPAATARHVLLAGYGIFLAVFCCASARDHMTQPGANLVLLEAVFVYVLPGWLRQEELASALHHRLTERRREERAALWALLYDLLPEFVLRERFGGDVKGPASERQSSLADNVGEEGCPRTWSSSSGSSSRSHCQLPATLGGNCKDLRLANITRAPEAKAAVVLHAELEGYEELWPGMDKIGDCGPNCESLCASGKTIGGDVVTDRKDELWGRLAVQDVHELLAKMDREVVSIEQRAVLTKAHW